MKGLLLKDFYLMMKYCRIFLVAVIFFIGISYMQGDSTFLFYPAIMIGMIPMTLYSYDEREKWDTYSILLPYTRAQLVSAKYITGLLCVAGVIAMVAITQLFLFPHTLGMQECASTLALMLILGLFGPSFLLPFVFKLGAEKGRIAYYIVFFLCFLLCGVLINSDVRTIWLYNHLGTGTLSVAMLGIYCASWLLSIALYQKREL